MTSPSSQRPTSGSPRASRWREARARVLTLLASLAVALLLAEGALRALGIGYGSAPLEGHPVLHHAAPPSYRMRVWSPNDEYGGFDAYFNGDGLSMRDELPPASTPSIVFLGDSFTVGMQVAEPRRFVARIGQDLAISAVNLGGTSYMPTLERLSLELFAERISPRAVVLQLYANDVLDGVEMDKIAVRDASGRVVAVPGARTPLSTRLARLSYVARLVRKGVLSFQYSRDKQRRSGGAWTASAWSPYFTKPIEAWFTPAELAVFERGVVEIRDVCRARGAPLLLWAVPDRGSILAGERDHFYEYVRALAERHAIRFVDVAPSFPRERVKELFFADDIHLTEQGHEAARAALEPALAEAIRAGR